MSSRLAVSAAALAVVLLALPSAAIAAPVLAPLKACYDAVSTARGGTEKIVVKGSGFTPNALVDIAVSGGQTFSGVPVDATGRLPASDVPAPFVRSGPKPFAVTVTEQGNPTQTVAAESLVTRLTVTVRPRQAFPRSRVRFRGTGFTARGPVFAHYVRGGKARRTVRLARRATGPCGDFTARRRQFPFMPSVGRWTIQIDQSRRYARRPAKSPFLRLRVDVRKG